MPRGSDRIAWNIQPIASSSIRCMPQPYTTKSGGDKYAHIEVSGHTHNAHLMFDFRMRREGKSDRQ
ncbi:hypothetical protein, partial [Peribacillus simplex]|uniref:hypothetical protein n=1 Tax=Peribacillus simplex TaxID=1478 RepID=UPI001C87B258